MENNSESKIYIFLDTNIFEQCKLFTGIDWKQILLQFKPDVEEKSVVLKIPYMVIIELDDHKKRDKEARKALATIRRIDLGDENPNFDLDISIRRPNWDDLDPELIVRLNENENDHQILAEILLFKNDCPQEDVLLITGDYVPYKLAEEFGIDAIYWLDTPFKEYFEKPKLEKKPDLELLFLKDGSVESSIDVEIKEPTESTIEDNEFKSIYEGSNPQHFSVLARLKSRDELESELEDYNLEMKNFLRFFKIEMVLKNNGEQPYTNITIEISTKLEKEMKIDYKENITIPEKPRAFSSFTSLIGGIALIPPASRKPNVTYYDIENQEMENNTDWTFGYHIVKIRHNDLIIIPYPIMIWIPEKPKAKTIIFNLHFTQDEPGRIKDQTLKINIPF